jgi:hypothetical protein
MTALPHTTTIVPDRGTNSHTSGLSGQGRRAATSKPHNNPQRTRALMRTLSLSLLYVLSMGVFVAAYGLLPLA